MMISDAVSQELVTTRYWGRPDVAVYSLWKSQLASDRIQTAAWQDERTSIRDVRLYVYLAL